MKNSETAIVKSATTELIVIFSFYLTLPLNNYVLRGKYMKPCIFSNSAVDFQNLFSFSEKMWGIHRAES